MFTPSSIAMKDPHFSPKLALLFTGFFYLLPALVTSVGINYGQIANNLPTPEHVVPLVKSIGATRVKLYDADPKVLKAFANTGVEFIVGLGNEYLSKMTDPSNAQIWVKQNVQCYLPATKIVSIAVGNEVLTFNDTSLSGCLLPAMQAVHTALVNLKLDSQVTVTTAHSVAILQNSYPPSSGSFRPDLKTCISPILDFLSKTCSPFLINAYPFFAYKANPKQVSLDFVLFQPNDGVVDPVTNLHYDNMLFAQIDAVYAALASLGYKKLPVQISETGWPSKGDQDELGASPENAKKYNGNLLKIIGQKKGTPARPNNDLNIFVFAMFNENLKPGPTSERNYGLFKPDGTPAYGLGFSGIAVSSGNSTSSSGGGGGSSGNGSGQNGPSIYLSPPANSSSGYLAISSSKERLVWSSWSILGMGLITMAAMAFHI
uniref:glucan endo-1,3-beta-glucosidase 11-like n=1 Tax=Erigeron canadensis TaxID=72917 RepID=UPI001CB908B3|nr:glucan endo-1,3-beta-glucosidase 11-like [Erigeron canadensis]